MSPAARRRKPKADPGTVVMAGVDGPVSILDPTGGDPTVIAAEDGRATVPTEHVGVVLAHFPEAYVVAGDPSEPSGSGDTPS